MDQKFECDVIIKTEPNNEDHNSLLTLQYKCHICEKSFKARIGKDTHKSRMNCKFFSRFCEI